MNKYCPACLRSTPALAIPGGRVCGVCTYRWHDAPPPVEPRAGSREPATGQQRPRREAGA